MVIDSPNLLLFFSSKILRHLLCSNQTGALHNFIIQERFMIRRQIRILLLTNISVAKATAVLFQELDVCVTTVAFKPYVYLVPKTLPVWPESYDVLSFSLQR